MEKLTRRNFFKSSTFTILALPIFAKAMGILNKGYAFTRDDSKVDKQGYVHDYKKAPKDLYDKHVAKIKTHLKEIKKADADVPAHCASCMQFKKDESDGYGECAMVMATGKADGKFVYKEGWCKVWTISKDRINKTLGV
jgi:hypothetical protein